VPLAVVGIPISCPHCSRRISPLRFGGTRTSTNSFGCSTGCLWFARTDTLGDPFEGSSTQAIQTSMRDLLTLFGPTTDDKWSTMNQASVRNTAVNCWHVSEHESAAMWRLYVASGQGIAMRSTIDRLLKSFAEGTADGSRDSLGAATVAPITFGAVMYIDHRQDPHPNFGRPYNLMDPFFLKRKSFEHEREFRAVLWDLPVRDNAIVFEESVFPQGGVAVPVTLATLIEAVYVSPGAASWFKQVVEVAAERFGLPVPVTQSRLDEDPIL